HRAIKKVSEGIESMKMNTAVASMMILVNDLGKKSEIHKEEYEILLKLLAPFAPHITEELWSMLGHKDSVHTQSWPAYDPGKIEKEDVAIAIQIDGKVRSSIIVSLGQSEEEVKTAVFALPEVQKWLKGKEPKKIIFVPKRIISITT
ncbi:MAG: class I tRNA ligase family protein, partial [Parcubacteria group bacterium]